MSTMFNDWLMRRMMSATAGSGPSNIIYELYNHTCDGTEATAINTGVYLFNTTTYPNGWTLELDFSFTGNVAQGSVIRCRNAESPYNGITARNMTWSDVMETQINDTNATANFAKGDRIMVLFDYDVATNMCSVTVKNMTSGTTSTQSQSMAGKTVNPPLVVGGENASDAANFSWKSGRFPKCTIYSLVVREKTS